MWFEAMGWIGGICFSLCAAPQAWHCFKTKSAQGLSWTFLLLWLFGEVLTMAYVWPTRQWPLLTNYLLNLVCLLVILRYKVKKC